MNVSIITPCFNASAYLESCLDSLSGQDTSKFEVILVDDCSTDDTLSVFQSIRDKYLFPIKYISNENNIGPSFSRKKGAESASYNYLAFCDVDDYFESSFIDIITKAIVVDSPDIVLFGYNMVLKQGIVKPHRFVNTDVFDATKETVFLTGVSSLCCQVVRKDLFLSINHPDLRNGEDMAIVPILISRANTIHILTDLLYNYISRPNSASKRKQLIVVDSLLLSFEYVRNNMPKCYSTFEEYLGINRILYGAILKLMKVEYNRKKALDIKKSFVDKYPSWKTNRYIKSLPLSKRVFIWCVSNNFIIAAWMFARIHTFVVG